MAEDLASPTTTTRPDLQIRPARPEDRAALEAIAAQIWEGDDYLPRVIDEWLSDPYDGFFVATLGDELMGVSKITRLGEGEWWLEGLRVAPTYQGQGFARILHHFVVNQVHQHGSGVVRFATASLNEAVCQLASETGFERVARFLPYYADPIDEPLDALIPLGPEDAARVWAWLAQSAHFERAQRSLEFEWVFTVLTEERLAERLAAGLVFGWPGHGSELGGVAVINPTGRERWPGDPTLSIAYLDAAPDDLPRLALDLRRLAAAQGRAHVHVKALENGDPLEQAGYRREWEGEIWLFARQVRLAAQAPIAGAPSAES